MTRSRTSLALVTVVTLMITGCGAADAEDATKGSANETVAVPDLVGDTMDTVLGQLNKAGLAAEATTPVGDSDWSAEAVAVSTTPAAGTQVKPGTTVKILEARKGEIVFFSKAMPNLIGTQWDGAPSGTTEDVDLYFEVTSRKPKGNEKAGTVVAQDPKAGAKLKFGQTMRVTVVDWPEDGDTGTSIDVPDVDLPNVCRHTKWC
ncbi:PASTA domain-containing protein [Actinoplanes philippinensis]|uniref:PASTA domain-containing protein n=1 Tax=Actinoplanes philippinensis TaxID=35752 RepID=UPI0033D18C72